MAVPAVSPVTIPDVLPTETDEDVELQTPLDGVSVSVMVLPRQMSEGPVMAPGEGLTVTILVALPVVEARVMVTTPGATPVTMPVEAPIVAIVGSLLDQVPGDVVEPPVSVIVAPTQTTEGPKITGAA